MKISATTKKIIDLACAIVGAFVVPMIVQLPYHAAPAVGLALGYLASDIATSVDTGQTPSTQTVTQQAASVEQKLT